MQLTGLMDGLDSQAGSRSSRFRLMDMGSGAGLPGLVLAMARPAWDIVNVEATGKKVAFQEKVKTSTGLDNAEIIRARAEDLGHNPLYRDRFDLVTARAVAHLRILAELGLPLAKLGGTLAFFKGPKMDQELKEAESAIAHLGGKIRESLAYRLSDIAQDLEPVPDTPEGRLCLIVVEKVSPTPAQFPRAFAQVKQRPIGP